MGREDVLGFLKQIGVIPSPAQQENQLLNQPKSPNHAMELTGSVCHACCLPLTAGGSQLSVGSSSCSR